MKKQDDKVVTDRRSFLKLAGAGVAASGAAVAAGGPAAAAADSKQRESLYRETDHVKRYYELARF